MGNKIILKELIHGCDIEIPLLKYNILTKDTKWAKGARVKKIDYNDHKNDHNDYFGIYLGRIKKHFCVGKYVRKVVDCPCDINIVEQFDTLNELKHNWILD